MADVFLKIRHAKRQNAQNLDLSSLSLTTLPDDLFSIKTLLNLNLSNNNLTSLNKAVENLKNLTELNLEQNELENLPLELTHLSNLKFLKIKGNPVEKYLVDWNLNWKESLKEYIENKNKIEEENTNLNSNSNINIYNNSTCNKNFGTRDKTPLDFSSLKSNHGFMNNTFTNLNKKETMTGDIPKCSLFDKYKEQKIKSIEISDEIKRLTSNKKLTTPVRIQSANLNKKEALNTILNTKFSIKTDTSISNKNSDFNFDKVNLTSVDEIKNKNNLMKENSENKFLKKIDDSSPQEGQMKNHEEKIKELSNQLKVYEDEIKRLKELHLKTEEKNLSMIKQLEEEIKQLKIQKFAQKTDNIHSVDNSINNIGNINFNVTNEDKVSSKSVLNNKRNWMDDDLAQANKNTSSNIHSHSLNLTEPDRDRIKELELKFQKEEQVNKRLKNDIERLNTQIISLKQNPNVSNDNIIKSVPQIDFDQIKIGSVIGQGGFSIIHQASWSGLEVAVKLIFDPNITEDLLKEFYNEIKMLFLLRHPNIILLIGVCTKTKLCIISEFVSNGSLFDLLHKTKKDIDIRDKMKIIKQLIKALAYIHINGIVHRDIKSHNVLVDEYFNLKICDFGLAKFKSELNYGSGQFAGTPAYMAPELFQKKAYDEKIDIFSFGTLIWEILIRKVPYEGLEVSEIKLRITNDEQIFIPKTVNSELANIIHSCRTYDPLKRPSFQELLTLNFNILP